MFLGSLAWGPIQFRVSEALCVLALFTPAAVPGLTLGCAIANIANIALSGTGMLGMLDLPVRWQKRRSSSVNSRKRVQTGNSCGSSLAPRAANRRAITGASARDVSRGEGA